MPDSSPEFTVPDWLGSKADNWWLRQSPQVLGLQFLDKIGRADRDNAIDLYIGEDYMDVLCRWRMGEYFKVKPEVFTREEKRAWLDKTPTLRLVPMHSSHLEIMWNVLIRVE